MGTEASLTPAVLPVRPGAEAVAELSVTNTGTVVDSFALEVLGVAAAWARCDPPVLSLFPGQSETVRVVFAPPAGPATSPGQLAFGIRIMPTEDAAHPAVEEGALDIAGIAALSADISPRTGRARGRRAGKYQVAVDNRGNAPAVVELAGWDGQDLVDVAVDPQTIEVGPGAAVFVKARTRARKRVWRGASVLHRFTVGVRPSGDPANPDAPNTPEPLEASLLQEAAIPGWLAKVSGLVVLALVALAVLWFTVLKPVVRDTATSATNQALTAAGITPAANANGSGGGAGGGSGSGGGAGGSGGGGAPSASASAAPTQPATSPTPPNSSTAAAPAAFSLELGSSQSLTASAHQTYTVTDLILQNPAGDAGTLNITRAGKALITTRMENYRDYDLHFVTPITVSPGQSLTIAVTCTKAGGGNSACSPEVLVSGMSHTA
ncbi:MAG TPA: hypothetical protein VFU73_15480 [Actinocrinis sp.]|nr:hypothetical protein [Actinocrinis sp.]